MKNKFYLLLLFLMAIMVSPSMAQITFKLKSVVGQQNPSANGLFSYGTLNNGTFQLFPSYGEDGTGAGVNISQKGWTFALGQESYPFLAYEQLNAAEVTPQPFPEFGIFMHPGDLPSVVRLAIPQNVHITYIKANIQRPTFGCGDNVGFTIKTNAQNLLNRTNISTSSSPTSYQVNSVNLTTGDAIYFVIDEGDDGNWSCDDTALDVEIAWEYDQILIPKLVGMLDCHSNTATFDIDYQPSGTLSLYKVGNAAPIATTTINQVGVSYKGQGIFTGLDLSGGGVYYSIASNNGQTASAQSNPISIIPCCTDAIAPNISVNNASICQGENAVLNATGCTNGIVSWNNGGTGTSISVNVDGTYTATCTVKGTAPCADGVSSASGIVVVNPLPNLVINATNCTTNLLTYSVEFLSNSIVTSTSGVVSGNIVSGISIGTNVILTAISSAGCTVSQNVISPMCNCPTLNSPISGGDKTICAGNVIPSLSANVGTGENADWYDAPTGGNLLLANSTTFIPTNAGIFYALARNSSNNCVSATRTAVSLVINPLPNLVVNATNCATTLLTYSVSFISNATVTSTSGVVSGNIVSGIPIGTNATLTTISSSGCTISENVISPICNCPSLNAPISGGDKTICSGANIPSLSVSVGIGETVDWYDSATGGNLLLANSATFTPTSAGTIYALARNSNNNCVSSARTAVSLTINSLPTLSINSTNCATNLLTYSISFTSNSPVTSTSGVVSGNIVTGIPIGTDAILTAISSTGCTISQNIISPICNCPTVNAPISGGDKTICSGETIPSLSISVGSGETADWYDAENGGNLLLANSTTFTPTNARFFYALARNSSNNCVSSVRTAVSLIINSLPTLSAGIPACSADLLTYSISFTSDGVVTSSAGTVSAAAAAEGIVSGIPTGTNVILTATSNAGCVATQKVNAPSCTCPTVNTPVSTGDKTICSGQAIPTLSVSVGSNEVAEWYDAPSGGNLLANGTSFTPNSETSNNGLFYVQARNTTNNCVSNARVLVKLIVNSNGATPTVVASKNPLILGETVTLSISNCDGIVTWNADESGTSITVKPTISTEYSAKCTANGGCIGGIGSIKIIVEVPKIEVKASPNVVCIGGSTTLSMAGCPGNDIYWTSPEYGRSNEIAPVYNGIVQAVSFTGHCVTSAGEASETIGVNIRQSQDFQIIASKNPIVLGESTVLSTTGCDGVVSWQNGQAIGNPITVRATSKYTEYVAECLSPNACGGKGKIIIEVKPPIITAKGKDVCWGSTATLSQSGCSTSFYWVVWKRDDFADAQAIDNPNTYPITEPTRFRVVCSTTVGEGASDILIRPIPLPNKPEIIPNKESYFTGETVELNVLNCNGHLIWSNGEEGSLQIRVKPVRTSTYTATCKGGYNCTSQSTIEVIVKTPTPKVKDLILCYGDTLVLNSGCPNNAGLWTDNWLDIPIRTIRKEGEKIRMFSSNTYGVSCEGEAGLSNMVAFSVTVKPKIEAPIIQSEKTVIIKGDFLELFANGCTETEWITNKNLQIAVKSSKIIVKPSETTTFSARCIFDRCYSDYGSFKVLVRPRKPKIAITLDTLCVGSSTTITAQNCEDGGILKWLNSNNNANSFEVFPQKDTTYNTVCIGLDSAERRPLISDTTTVKIKVYQTPKAPTISALNLIIIEDERTTLTAINCEGMIIWNTGATGRTLTVSPTKATTYSATCSVWKCVSEKTEITIKVRPKQLEISDGNETNYFLYDTLCLQKQLTLSVLTSCNGTIVWNNGQSGRSITIVGTKNEVYEVFCQNADNEKSDISTATILVKDYNFTDAYIYPNPTSGKLFIQSKGCIDGVMLRLYTFRGELIYEGGGQERYLDSLVLDLFNLPSEVYVLHIIGTDGTKPVTLRKRVVKTNKE